MTEHNVACSKGRCPGFLCRCIATEVDSHKSIIAKACIDHDAERQRIAFRVRKLCQGTCDSHCRFHSLAERIANGDFAEASR